MIGKIYTVSTDVNGKGERDTIYSREAEWTGESSRACGNDFKECRQGISDRLICRQ